MYDLNEPSALFHALHHAHHRQVVRAQAERGLASLGSPMLLMTLHRGEAQGRIYSQREVAKELRLAPATVAVALKSLEREGFVCRRADEADARRNRVELTQKGRQAVRSCAEGFRAVDEQMLAGFSRSEQEQLTRFLQRMAENLGGVPQTPPSGPLPPPPFCLGEEGER